MPPTDEVFQKFRAQLKAPRIEDKRRHRLARSEKENAALGTKPVALPSTICPEIERLKDLAALTRAADFIENKPKIYEFAPTWCKDRLLHITRFMDRENLADIDAAVEMYTTLSTGQWMKLLGDDEDESKAHHRRVMAMNNKAAPAEAAKKTSKKCKKIEKTGSRVGKNKRKHVEQNNEDEENGYEASEKVDKSDRKRRKQIHADYDDDNDEELVAGIFGGVIMELTGVLQHLESGDARKLLGKISKLVNK